LAVLFKSLPAFLAAVLSKDLLSGLAEFEVLEVAVDEENKQRTVLKMSDH
jgi:hypothetical protein